jgi:hypothetical protein
VKTKVLIAFTIVVITCSFRNNNEIKPVQILHQMFDSIKNIKTIRLKVTALERVDKKFLSASSFIKLQVNPRKLYYRNIQKKVQVLYNSEVSPYKALVRPNTFPYMSIWLDPTGNIMRKNQHYTIHELGFEFIGTSIALTINKDREGLNNFSYLGKVHRNGYNCYYLQYENKSYGYTTYTVREKETASSIATRLCVNDYLLRNANDLLNDFGYLRKGRVLKVPNLYCKKAILYIDDRYLIPVSLSIYDDAGLFESYDYFSLEINKPFLQDEFNRDYKEYSF